MFRKTECKQIWGCMMPNVSVKQALVNKLVIENSTRISFRNGNYFRLKTMFLTGNALLFLNIELRTFLLGLFFVHLIFPQDSRLIFLTLKHRDFNAPFKSTTCKELNMRFGPKLENFPMFRMNHLEQLFFRNISCKYL